MTDLVADVLGGARSSVAAGPVRYSVANSLRRPGPLLVFPFQWRRARATDSSESDSAARTCVAATIKDMNMKYRIEIIVDLERERELPHLGGIAEAEPAPAVRADG